MSSLFTALGLITAAFLVHLCLWRIHRPSNHTLGLLAVFGITYLVGLPVLYFCPVTHWIVQKPCLFLQITIFHIVISLAYIAFYSILEEDSPSLSIVTMVSAAGSVGLEKEVIESRLQAGDILESRIAASMKGGLVKQQGESYFLTSKGRFFARLFLMMEKLMGLGRGG